MATRDTSSKIGFSNTNVYVLYKKAKQEESNQQAAAAAYQSGKIIRPEDSSPHKIEKFEPAQIASAPAMHHDEHALFSQLESIDHLKKNMERLQELHSRIRIMLNDLEAVVATKKK